MFCKVVADKFETNVQRGQLNAWARPKKQHLLTVRLRCLQKESRVTVFPYSYSIYDPLYC
jgi:hypothetical protein